MSVNSLPTSATDPRPWTRWCTRTDRRWQPPFQAAIELRAASRTDPQLRAALLPAEKRLGSALRTLFHRHAGIPDAGAARTAFESLMALIRGLELTRLMRTDQTLADQVIDDWLTNVARLRRG